MNGKAVPVYDRAADLRDVTATGLALVRAANAAAAREALGLGSAALAATGDFDPAGTGATAAASAVSAHVGQSDPHSQYALESALGTLAYQSGTFSGTFSGSHSGTSSGTNTGDQDLSGYATTAAVAATYAPLASPALTGTPIAPTASGGTNTTQVATTAFVQAAVSAAVAGLLDLKGDLNCSANPNYPAGQVGDTYYVTAAGRIGGASGKVVDIGDAVVCKADNAGGTEAAVGASWFVLEKNLVGALLAANNLSDVANGTTALTNLGGAAPTGTGAVVRASSPTLVTPNIGSATGTLVTIANNTATGATFTRTGGVGGMAAGFTNGSAQEVRFGILGNGAGFVSASDGTPALGIKPDEISVRTTMGIGWSADVTSATANRTEFVEAASGHIGTEARLSVRTAATPTAGGAVMLAMLSTGIGIYAGSGVPTVSAPQGSLFLRTDGSSTTTRAYINTNGSTGWTNLTTGA